MNRLRQLSPFSISFSRARGGRLPASSFGRRPRPPQTLPHVHLVATGGTISNRDGGRLTAEDLAKSMPGLDKHARLTYEQFANVASSQLTLEQWLGLSRRVNELFADRPGAGRHRRHQRDRHARRDRVLPAPDRPRHRGRSSSSGRCAIRARSATKARPTCSRACASPPSRRRATRACWSCSTTRSTPRATSPRPTRFGCRRSAAATTASSASSTAIASCSSGSSCSVTRRKSEFDVGALKELPRVDVVMVYQGAPGDLIKAAVDAGAKGHRDCRRRRRRDQRDARRGARLRGAERRVRRDQHAHRLRTHRAAARVRRPPGAPGQRRTTAAPAVHRAGRGSRAAQGAHAADAGADEDHGSRRDSAHLLGGRDQAACRGKMWPLLHPWQSPSLPRDRGR